MNSYLETKIRYKIEFCTFLFNNKNLNLNNITLYFNFSENYAKELIKELNIQLNSIAEININKQKDIYIHVKNNATQQQILHKIYNESPLLNYLHFLINNDDQQPFTCFIEQNYHSVANAYRIKNRAEEFLHSCGLHIKKNQIHGAEYRIRFLIALLYSEYGIRYEKITLDDIQLARTFIMRSNQVVDEVFLENTLAEFQFFEILLILTWKRQHFQLDFNEWHEKEELKKIFIYPKIKQNFQNIVEESSHKSFTQSDYEYLLLTFCVTDNCLYTGEWTKMEIKKVHHLVFNCPKIQHLITLIQKKLNFGKEIIETRSFRVAIVYLYKLFILNLHPLLPEKYSQIGNSQSITLEKMQKKAAEILKEWKQISNIQYEISDTHIFTLALHLESIYQVFVPGTPITIITTTISEYETLALQLSARFNTHKIKINHMLSSMINPETLENLQGNLIIITPSMSNYIEKLTLSKCSVVICVSMSFLPEHLRLIEQSIQHYQQAHLLKII